MMKFQTLLFFGAPGCGKGTQGQTLGNLPRFFHCACGDVFRSVDTRTEIGRAFVEYSSKGQLVPDEITVKLWENSITSWVNTGNFKPDIDYLVLDGIPRDVNQAKLMDSMINVRRVYHLTCPDRDELYKRLKKRAIKDNRLDDANESVIQERLNTYERLSKPLLEYYGPGMVKTIDATMTPALVLLEILKDVTTLSKEGVSHPLQSDDTN